MLLLTMGRGVKWQGANMNVLNEGCLLTWAAGCKWWTEWEPSRLHCSVDTVQHATTSFTSLMALQKQQQ